MMRRAVQHGFPESELSRAIKMHPGYEFSLDWTRSLHILEDGDPIDIGAYHFRCVQTPGHSRGHTCLYDPTHRLFLSGDHILIDITPTIQCWFDGQNPLALYLDSLDRVSTISVDLMLPGHRRLITDHRARIDQLKDHHQKRCKEILDIISNDAMTAYEVAARMSWDIQCKSWEDFPLQQKWFALGEAISHLIYLEEKGQLARSVNGSPVYFSLS